MSLRAFLFLAIAALLAIAFIGAGSGRAHDIYRDWQRPDGNGSCCSSLAANPHHGDCRPTTAYMGDDGLWRVDVGRPEPMIVPANKIVPRAPDRRCHVCEKNGYLHCFAPCDPLI